MQHGGAIFVGNGTLTIRNSILWGNTAAAGDPEIFTDSGGTTNISYSDVQGGCPSGSTCSTQVISGNPYLGTLGDYGGMVDTLPLLPGSAAIDMGDKSTCLSIDARGISRPQVGACDMGAYESRGFTLTAVSGDHQSTKINYAFGSPLVVSVSAAYAEPVDNGYLTFTPPASSAEAVLSTSLVKITGGQASVTATANGTGGSYNVTASAAGISTPATFHLTNGLYFYLYLPFIRC